MTMSYAARYQKDAMRTIGVFDDTDDMMVFAALEIGAECGEVCNLVYKHIYQGHPLDVEKIKLELGDVMWGVAAIHASMKSVMTMPVKSEYRAGNAKQPFRQRITRASLRLEKWAGIVAADTETYVVSGTGLYLDDVRNAARMVFRLLCTIADCLGLSPFDVMDANIAKLKRRYPDGFSPAHSIARVDVGQESTVGVVATDPYLWESGT